MNRLIFLLILIYFLFTSCNSKYEQLTIDDVSKDTSIVVYSTFENPSTFSFEVSGKIDDTCKIMNVPISKNELNKRILVDSYSKKTILEYDNYKAKKGNLTISYYY